ncbi:hypothetical protein MMC12_003514 [Toensbergia leucococca]|nr:hypothetical protein [Toensbergia leucococca]
MAAACYMAFGRIIYWVTPDIHRGFRSLWVPARFLAPFFVLFDVVAFCIQLLGLVLILSKTSTSKPEHENQKGNGMAQGIEILCLGLIIQAVVVGAFALLAARFLIVSRQWRYAWPEGGSPTWRSMAWIIILASILVMFRTLFRILEFTLSSSQNYLTHHEWPLYAFDALPILLVLTSFNSIHPGRYMPKAYITLNHNFKHVPKEPEFKSTPSIRMEEEQYPSYPLAAVTAQRYAPSPLRPVIGNSF